MLSFISHGSKSNFLLSNVCVKIGRLKICIILCHAKIMTMVTCFPLVLQCVKQMCSGESGAAGVSALRCGEVPPLPQAASRTSSRYWPSQAVSPVSVFIFSIFQTMSEHAMLHHRILHISCLLYINPSNIFCIVHVKFALKLQLLTAVIKFY